MKITIVHAHWNNRGDEAALRALIDEVVAKYPGAEINVYVLVRDVKQFPYTEPNIHLFNMQYPKRKNKLDYWLSCISKGKIAIFKNSKEFIKMVKGSDLVLHAPGGPSIGDIYFNNEEKYLLRLNLVRKMGIRYAFYAPSMGPFKSENAGRNRLRKKVLEGAEFIYLREGQSADYVKEFGVKDKEIKVSLDSAFQHYGDEEIYGRQLAEYTDLNNFLKSYDRVVGMTTTDLKWHPVHGQNPELKENIKKSFDEMIDYLGKKGIGVLFVPQLFGEHHDMKYMKSFAGDNCFVMDETHDCYFQQYVIGKLYAVIGMRYHSNIFSAKMGTPFVSVAYEQKMSGFMEISGLSDYCIPIKDLSAKALIDKFEKLENNYSAYKNILAQKKEEWVKKSHLTTDEVFEVLDRG